MHARLRSMPARIFLLTWVAYAGYYLCRKNLSVLLPQLASEQGQSKGDLATLVFAYSVAYAAGQFLAGPLADRWGARPVVTVGMLGSSLATFAFGMAGSTTALVAAQAVNGLCQAAGWSGLVKIMACWFDRQGRGVVMAWWSTNYVLGGFVATVLATFLATGPLLPALGWRRGAWGPALLLALLGVLFGLWVRERPAGRPAATSRAPYREVLGSASLQVVAASYFCIKLTRYAFLFWLPLYMVERLGYGASEAGYTSSLYELLGFLGVPLAGYVSDRLMGSRRFPVGAMMLWGLSLSCLLYPALSGSGRWGNVLAIALVGMMTFGPDTLMGGTAVQDLARPEAAATAAGYVNGVGSLGQLLSPLLVSQVVERYGWDALFSVFVVIAQVGALLLATRWRQTAPQAREAAA